MPGIRILAFLAISGITSCILTAQPNIVVCSESGSGAAYLKACITRDGNIVNFESPQGKEHIGVGEVLEGPRACWWDSSTEQLEIRSAVDPDPLFQDWAPPFKIEQPNGPNTFPVTLHRRTLDGLLEMKQVFARDAAERELTLTLTITNKSGDTLTDFGLERLVSLHIDNTPGDSDGITSSRSVLAFDQPWLHGGNPSNAVTLTAATTGTTVVTGRFLGDSPLDQCGTITLSAQSNKVQALDAAFCPGCYFVGYGLGNLPNNAARTVKLVYRAF